MGQFDMVLKDLFNKALPSFGHKVAVKCDGSELDYEQLNRRANQLAHSFLRHGLHSDDAVALIMSNCIEFVIADVAIMKAGLVKVPLNDMLGEKEIAYILQNSEAKMAIVGPNFYPVVERIRSTVPNLQVIVAISDDFPKGFTGWTSFLQGSSETNPEVDVKPYHKATIGYTGGTTGLPKGVVQTQQNQVMNLFCHIIELGINEQDIILAMTPLPHSAGRYVLTGLLKGATHIVSSKFDPHKALQFIEEEQVTFTFMVPTMIYRVLDLLEEESFDTASIKTIMYGAAPITEERLRQGLQAFGPVFYQFFGQTEAPNFITRLTKQEHSTDPHFVHRLRSCGKPSFMSEVRIVDDQGKDVPRGEKGEIIVQSPFVMEGYHNLPDKTAEALIDGWLYTGDVGKIDEDGYVYLLDRKKDMIISGGMNIYCSEVENVIGQHPSVKQVAVIGIPHSDWGEQVLAVVIPDPTNPPTEEELFSFSKVNLSTYKQPKEFKFVPEIPLTAYGKMDKKKLRAPYWGETERDIH